MSSLTWRALVFYIVVFAFNCTSQIIGGVDEGVLQNRGYVLTDPEHFDAQLRAEKEIDKDRSVRQCFCGESRHIKFWQSFHEQLHTGMEADPTFQGDWVHRLCGVAYPVIFQAVTVDADDTFVMNTDCGAGIVAMVAVCAQSSALMHLQSKDHRDSLVSRNALASKREGDTGPWRSSVGRKEFWRTARVVREEGFPVNDILGPIPLDECLAHCESNDECLSVAHGPNGCHLKSRCIQSDDALIPEAALPSYHTYYVELCQETPLQNSHLEEMQQMMTFAIRALEFAFHCLDASPWPFLLSEVLLNYALAFEAPDDFFWQRAADRVASPYARDGTAKENLLSMAPPKDSHVFALPPIRLVLVKLQVRWTRGLESEAAFWRKKMSLDPDENVSLERLKTWLKTGEVTWFYDDPCDWLRRISERDGGRTRRAPRILNAGSGPFAPRPLECMLDPAHLPVNAIQADSAPVKYIDGEPRTPWPVPVIAADGLARFYTTVMDENGFAPPHTPLQCPVEDLHRCFPPSYFDIVHIRNALDHVFDPLLGIERMLRVVRPGGWVLLRHARNEGVPGKFRNGLHQWSFDTEGENPTSFIIWNPEIRVNVNQYLLQSGLAAEMHVEQRAHPSADAPPDERYVWVDIRRPTVEEAAHHAASLIERA